MLYLSRKPKEMRKWARQPSVRRALKWEHAPYRASMSWVAWGRRERWKDRVVEPSEEHCKKPIFDFTWSDIGVFTKKECVINFPFLKNPSVWCALNNWGGGTGRKGRQKQGDHLEGIWNSQGWNKRLIVWRWCRMVHLCKYYGNRTSYGLDVDHNRRDSSEIPFFTWEINEEMDS